MGVQYHPNHNKQFHEEAYGLSAKELKEEVRALLTETDAVVQVKLIDSIERLRLGYHFVEEIERLLNNMLLCKPTSRCLLQTIQRFAQSAHLPWSTLMESSCYS
ncbi:probable terpene synthase 9 isoform X2 [Asparagus officinalis]|uniref:probable terpene synthase 9 isoform X2 n=1 Tax=Asparagus officinalis TaxID=4686 RepID=UPI00098E4A71|nr:probable terpene synthase 9 isoform X2 [Asparagus officinalis]